MVSQFEKPQILKPRLNSNCLQTIAFNGQFLLVVSPRNSARCLYSFVVVAVFKSLKWKAPERDNETWVDEGNQSSHVP